MPVLEPRVTDIERPAARTTRKIPRHPFGIGTALANTQQQMGPFARRREAELLVDDEILGLNANTAAHGRRTERARRVEREGAPAVGYGPGH